MTVIAWEGTGASVLSLTWRRDRGGSVQGFPWGHYGPCALDERLSFGRMAVPMPSQPAEAKRNGRGQKSPAGVGDRARFYFR